MDPNEMRGEAMSGFQRGAVFLACVMAALALAPFAAAPAADRPAGATAPPSTQAAPPMPPRPFFPMAPRLDVPMTPQELESAIVFLQEYSPRRSEIIIPLLHQGNRPGLARQILTRYRELMLVKSEDPELYETKIRLLRVEDDLFGEAMAARAERQEGHKVSEETRRKLEQAAMKFVDLRIEERQHLIAKLQAGVARDINNKAAAARERIARELNGGALQGDFGPDNFIRGDGAVPSTAP
jgi:hypothetical protein